MSVYLCFAWPCLYVSHSLSTVTNTIDLSDTKPLWMLLKPVVRKRTVKPRTLVKVGELGSWLRPEPRIFENTVRIAKLNVMSIQ